MYTTSISLSIRYLPHLKQPAPQQLYLLSLRPSTVVDWQTCWLYCTYVYVPCMGDSSRETSIEISTTVIRDSIWPVPSVGLEAGDKDTVTWYCFHKRKFKWPMLVWILTLALFLISCAANMYYGDPVYHLGVRYMCTRPPFLHQSNVPQTRTAGECAAYVH